MPTFNSSKDKDNAISTQAEMALPVCFQAAFLFGKRQPESKDGCYLGLGFALASALAASTWICRLTVLVMPWSAR